MGVISPASGAVVMGTGIVSTALAFDHRETFSRILLAVTVPVWAVLGVALVGGAVRDRPRVRRDSRSPAAVTAVAGTAVLGARLLLLGWGGAAIALLAIAVGLWLALLNPVLRNWVTPAAGVSLMLIVSTESLAVLSAALAEHERTGWLLYAALVPFLLGVALYGIVMSRFDLRQLAVGRGDHWITGGALAISTLAAGLISLSAHSLHELGAVSGILKTVSLALWAVTIAWVPVLVATEALHPRLGYDERRWSTVFPVGLCAACSFVVGDAVGAPAITDFERAWVWVAVGLWLVVFAGMLRRGARLGRV